MFIDLWIFICDMVRTQVDLVFVCSPGCLFAFCFLPLNASMVCLKCYIIKQVHELQKTTVTFYSDNIFPQEQNRTLSFMLGIGAWCIRDTFINTVFVQPTGRVAE